MFCNHSKLKIVVDVLKFLYIKSILKKYRITNILFRKLLNNIKYFLYKNKLIDLIHLLFSIKTYIILIDKYNIYLSYVCIKLIMIYLISIEVHRKNFGVAREHLANSNHPLPIPDHFRIASRITTRSEGCSKKRAAVGDSAVSRATIGRRSRPFVSHSAAA